MPARSTGAIAPSSSVFVRVRDRPARGRPPSAMPRPVQSGQAPNGELKEKERGSSSSKDRSSYGQYRCSENIRSRCGSSSGRSTKSSDDHAAGEAERGLHRVGEPALGAESLTVEPVDDHLDGVLLLLLQRRRLGELDHHAVDPGPAVALGLQLAEQLDVLALALADHRGQHLEAACPPPAPAPGRRSAAGVCRAIGRPQTGQCGWPIAGVEQAQVVVDLGDGADGRARVASRWTSGRSRPPGTGPR